MPRPRASVPPDAIRIEDEVWQEAFTRREPARPRPERRLHAIDGGRSTGSSVARSAAVRVSERRWDIEPDRPLVELDRALVESEPERRRPQVLVPNPEAFAPARSDEPAAPAPRTAAAGGVPGRRTITIRGYGAERNLPWTDTSSRRPQRKAYERAGFKPDRVALWALMLCILLVIVAVASPHG